MKREITGINFVVVHLGGGITVAAIAKGRIIDCNDALLGMGPFSPERAGALPLEPLIKMVLSGGYSLENISRKLTKQSGLKGYLGTGDVREVLRRIDAGDQEAALIYRAMIYQIAKEIGAMSTVLKGRLDRIIITGGMAHSKRIVKDIEARVAFIAKSAVYPGENELEALAAGGFRALDGEQEVKIYQD